MINFDFPMNLTDYLHRVGRTGRVRAGAKNSETSETTSFMTHNRDVRMALIIEVSSLSQFLHHFKEQRDRQRFARNSWRNRSSYYVGTHYVYLAVWLWWLVSVKLPYGTLTEIIQTDISKVKCFQGAPCFQLHATLFPGRSKLKKAEQEMGFTSV